VNRKTASTDNHFREKRNNGEALRRQPVEIENSNNFVNKEQDEQGRKIKSNQVGYRWKTLVFKQIF